MGEATPYCPCVTVEFVAEPEGLTPLASVYSERWRCVRCRVEFTRITAIALQDAMIQRLGDTLRRLWEASSESLRTGTGEIPKPVAEELIESFAQTKETLEAIWADA